MTTGKSGYIDFTGTWGFVVRVHWSEIYDVLSNQSVVQITKVQVKSTNWYGVAYYPNGTISVNDSVVVTMKSAKPTHEQWITALNTFCDLTGSPAAPWSSSNIKHDDDGSKSISISVNLAWYTISGNYGSGWTATGSSTVSLTVIPRASTIGASDANIGSKSTIVVTRKSSAYTHSIAYKFGNLTGYVTADGSVSNTEVTFDATSISWTIPTDFYAQIPNDKTGTCTLTIKTYSESTQIGDAQTDTFTVTAAQSACAPSVSGSVVDSNSTTKALTGDESKLVRYYSTALCTITATAKNSATISEKKIGGTAVSGTTRSIANVEVDSVSFYAKDSRGYEANTDVDFTLVPYVILTNNPIGQRTDPTSGNATLTIKGDYFNDSFGLEENSISAKYRIRPVGGSYGDYITAEVVTYGNSYSANAGLTGLDYRTQYELEVVVSDKLEEVTKTAKINKGIPVCDWGEKDFRFNVPLEVSADSFGTEPPTDAKLGQVYFQKKIDGTYSILIYNGETW